MRPSYVEVADADLGLARVLVLYGRVLDQHDVAVESCSADVLILRHNLTGTGQLVSCESVDLEGLLRSSVGRCACRRGRLRRSLQVHIPLEFDLRRELLGINIGASPLREASARAQL